MPWAILDVRSPVVLSQELEPHIASAIEKTRLQFCKYTVKSRTAATGQREHDPSTILSTLRRCRYRVRIVRVAVYTRTVFNVVLHLLCFG
jgi:hypothetical protein